MYKHYCTNCTHKPELLILNDLFAGTIMVGGGLICGIEQPFPVKQTATSFFWLWPQFLLFGLAMVMLRLSKRKSLNSLSKSILKLNQAEYMCVPQS